MNKQLRTALMIALVLVVAVGSFLVGRNTRAEGDEPGSAADPLVSKSYVDTLTSLQVINLKAGQTLIADGGTELILRGGKATIVTSTDGVANLTGAKDLVKGTSVPLNSLLLVPRSDGRGIKATVDCWVMVRGSFVIK